MGKRHSEAIEVVSEGRGAVKPESSLGKTLHPVSNEALEWFSLIMCAKVMRLLIYDARPDPIREYQRLRTTDLEKNQLILSAVYTLQSMLQV